MSVSDTKIGFSIDETNETTNDKNAKLPYVVILDEINRTDISRVFGELFSAIENRGEDIDLLLPTPDNQNQYKYLRLKKHNLKLNIPENIYFIGTMNEIDFSLERVDFALRRRFIWELHDFDKETLSEIIEYRLGASADDIFQEDKDDFRDKCVALNKKIEEVMGETYHLGHAFFADIANLYKQLKENGMSDCWKKAKNILWEISIKPTLEAYCGTMDSGLKERYLGKKNNYGEFYTAFFG
jgi:5-methylcytosine-specific restriction protein B